MYHNILKVTITGEIFFFAPPDMLLSELARDRQIVLSKKAPEIVNSPLTKNL